MIFHKELTRREKALLLVLAILLLIYCYLFLIHQPISNRMSDVENQTLTTQTEITALQGLQARMLNMERELELHKDEAPIPDYDNLQQVIAFLHQVLPDTTQYDFSYTEPTPVTEGRPVAARDLSLQFKAPSYQAARSILDRLEMSPYRCLMSNLDLTPEGDSLEAGPVSVSVTVTFFENMEQAAPAEPPAAS